ISGPPSGGPDNQAYLRVPSIPSVAWQPYPSPPRDGEEPIALRPRLTTGLPLSGKGGNGAPFSVAGIRVAAPPRHTSTLGCVFPRCKWSAHFFCFLRRRGRAFIERTCEEVRR